MEWKECQYPGYEGLYLISESGEVYSRYKHKIIAQRLGATKYPYYIVGLRETKDKPSLTYVHKLVAYTFLGMPPEGKPEVNHIDMNKLNNHYTNLEWISHRDNIRKARAMKPWKSGAKKGSKSSEEAKVKIALSKLKQVKRSDGLIYDSIALAALGESSYREAIYRACKQNKPLNGFYFTLLGTKKSQLSQ